MSELKIGFTGDVAFSRYYKDRFAQKGLVDEKLVSFLTENDYNVFNIEGAMCRPTQKGTFVHNNPPEGISLLSTMQPDVWNLANNHMMDAGDDGCAETLRHAAENGYRTIGAGMKEEDAFKPVYFPEAGGVGVFGMVYAEPKFAATPEKAGCANWDRMAQIRATIREIKKTCRWCVAVIHGGREFCDVPMQDVRDRYHRYLRAGVDVIVAHHPHVPQNWERVGDKYIFYSLGNFIFDTDYQRAQFHTDTGVLLRLLFTEKSVRHEAVGTKIDRSNGVVSASPLPAIFTELTEADYEKLYPLVAVRFKEHILKRLQFVHPDLYPDITDPETITRAMDYEVETRLAFDLTLKEALRYDGKPLPAEYAALEAYLI